MEAHHLTMRLFSASFYFEHAPSVSCQGSTATHNKEVAIILRVYLSVPAERGRSVGRADCQLLEDLFLQRAIRVDRVHITVFAIRVDDPVRIYCRSVYAPLESSRLVTDACYRSVCLASAA